MPRRGPHPLDGLADELQAWLEGESDWYAQALIGDYRAPFSANISEQQKLDAYRRMAFQTTPDGSGVDFTKPNIDGRQKLQDRVGVEQYAQIMRAVMPGQSMQHLQTADTGQTPSEEYATNPEY